MRNGIMKIQQNSNVMKQESKYNRNINETCVIKCRESC